MTIPTQEEIEEYSRIFIAHMESYANEQEHKFRPRCGACGEDTFHDTYMGSPRCVACDKILVYVYENGNLKHSTSEWVRGFSLQKTLDNGRKPARLIRKTEKEYM